MQLKILSFNVLHFENWKEEKIDFDFFAEAIKSTGADIIGLNEVHGAGEDEEYTAQTEIMAEKLGFYGYFAKATEIDGANPFGNAVLSRYPIKTCEVIPIPDPEPKAYDGYYETRCLLKAVIDVDGGLPVYVTHFGLNPDEQINAVKTVCDNVKGRCLFMGDLNVTPDDAVLTDINRLLKDTANEGEEMLSFPADEPFKKIDYIYIGEGIKKISAKVLPMVVSDHRPYFAEIEI